MINLHLNGDIVRCPDMRAIQTRAAEIRDSHNICKYNYHENTCPEWLIKVNTHKHCGRCTLAGSADCPGYQNRLKIGLLTKTFSINNKIYRKCASAAHYLVKESKNKVLFLTLTFPKFKRKVSDNEINSYFSKYVENLRTNYDCGGYVAVREFGKNTHRIHFHILLSIPFVPFPILNRAWCNCISDICYNSGRAVLSDPKTRFIKNPTRAMRYVCKYFAKCKNQKSLSRLIFISNNVIQKPVSLVGSVIEILKGYKSIYINQTSDYSTCFRITDNNEFDRFCNNFLYPLFELQVKKPDYLYSFPVNSS